MLEFGLRFGRAVGDLYKQARIVTLRLINGRCTGDIEAADDLQIADIIAGIEDKGFCFGEAVLLDAPKIAVGGDSLAKRAYVLHRASATALTRNHIQRTI
jgi:hypothetical protein